MISCPLPNLIERGCMGLNIKTPIYIAEPIMYNSVRVLGRVRGSVAVRRVLPNAVATTAR